jgi:hypothetical protein
VLFLREGTGRSEKRRLVFGHYDNPRRIPWVKYQMDARRGSALAEFLSTDSQIAEQRRPGEKIVDRS